MRSRGFTLIESVVALAILALTLTVVYPILGSTLHQAAQQRHRDGAWLTAQSLLDQMRGDHSLTVGERSGITAQGLKWKVVIAPTPLTAAPAFQVTIKVSWGEQPGRHIELRSIELAPPL